MEKIEELSCSISNRLLKTSSKIIVNRERQKERKGVGREFAGDYQSQVKSTRNLKDMKVAVSISKDLVVMELYITINSNQ